MGTTYDDNAAGFFGITLLVLYLVPACIHIFGKIMAFRRPLKVDYSKVCVHDTPKYY